MKKYIEIDISKTRKLIFPRKALIKESIEFEKTGILGPLWTEIVNQLVIEKEQQEYNLFINYIKEKKYEK